MVTVLLIQFCGSNLSMTMLPSLSSAVLDVFYGFSIAWTIGWIGSASPHFMM